MTSAKGTSRTDALAEALDTLLDGYTRAYERVRADAVAQRDAIRKGDAARAAAAATDQAGVLETILALDRSRDELINAAAASLPHAAGRGRLTLRRIAGALPGGRAAELVARAESLRTLVIETKALTASVAGAAAILVGHFEGLMRQVGRQLSHSGTYSPRGYVEAGGQVVTCLDLRT